MISQIYAFVVAGATMACFAFRGSADFRSGVALLVNWVVTIAVYEASPMETVWAPLIVLDGLTAYVILRQPARLVQGVIGGLLLGQLVFHVAFGWVGTSESFGAYRLAINLAGWLQVAALLMGATYDGGRKIAFYFGWPAADTRLASDGVSRFDKQAGP